MGRFENILEIEIPTPVVNSGGYKYSGQGSDASLVTERHEQQQLTDTSLRRSISDRETRQPVYCTTSVRIGYILINYVVRYTPVFVRINRHLITSETTTARPYIANSAGSHRTVSSKSRRNLQHWSSKESCTRRRVPGHLQYTSSQRRMEVCDLAVTTGR